MFIIYLCPQREAVNSDDIIFSLFWPLNASFASLVSRGWRAAAGQFEREGSLFFTRSSNMIETHCDLGSRHIMSFILLFCALCSCVSSRAGWCIGQRWSHNIGDQIFIIDDQANDYHIFVLHCNFLSSLSNEYCCFLLHETCIIVVSPPLWLCLTLSFYPAFSLFWCAISAGLEQMRYSLWWTSSRSNSRDNNSNNTIFLIFYKVFTFSFSVLQYPCFSTVRI